ncbi:HlyD family type I secretion periplasmic adaptor subunit [Ruegeria sp. R14_0]|uniref:HlyD family type I secretion periplasmic adaptor subunit n=1 Tax=Ruegeria sp. R14_0 TaxID=2821100 RepID=UPI001ADA5C06|nr:HlyD family type I secretion periplasmic adaptor subunit [Ruegeria sp. R14_0]MBO9447534.1 HlyD family type I secretion periplasmic adaptor subunit [Ruegeria sp. R14_0]
MNVDSKKTRVSGPMERANRKRQLRRPRFAAFLSLAVSAMIGSLVVLAGQTGVPQITRAPGTILPIGAYPQIETMPGGIVRAVHVRDGQLVEAGDLLVELDHPDLSRERSVLSGQLAGVRRDTDTATAILAILDRESLPSRPEIAALSGKGLVAAAARLELYAESQRIQGASIVQQEETLNILTQAAQFAQDRVQKKEEILERYAQLRARGLKSLSDFLEEEDEVDAVRAAASDARVRVAEAQSALMLARASKAEETLALRDELLTRMSELEQKQSELSVSLDTVTSKLAALRITAPARGVVQAVTFPNPGEVIAPGEVIFEILPTHQTLVVEARIANSEVGHVDADQPVSVSVDTFDARRFGKVEGRLQSIYPVPMTDEQTGETYFRAAFELSEDRIGAGTWERPLQAGMTVVAEMTTGEQTLLAYLLKPVQMTMERAFNER